MPRELRDPLEDVGPRSDLLVVEGADDFHAFIGLFDAHKIRHKCRLLAGSGFENIRDTIDTRIDESEIERIGFVIDADENVKDRWTSLRHVLIDLCGFSQVPDMPEPSGTILKQVRQDGEKTVGLWLMPDNVVPGALEEFIRRLIPKDDPLWEYAMSSVNGLPSVPEPRTDNWVSKAYIHTWLAWQEEPGKPMGQAITKRYLNPHSEATKPLMEWLKRLFDIPL